ncbi:MAG: hypothetical protein R8K22_06410, partial [Mariprofundaceae bacterium]
GKSSLPFARLRRFNQQIPSTGHAWSATSITCEDHIIGQQDILEPMLSQFAAEPTLVQEHITTMLEALPGGFNKTHLLVLIDCMNAESGFLAEPVADIARIYNQLLFRDTSMKKIQAFRLEQSRQYIRDNGPIPGLLSKDVLELKQCCARCLNNRMRMRRGDLRHHKLTRLNAWLQAEGENAHKNFFPQLELLACKQSNRNARRKITATMTQRLLRCDATSAAILSHAYQQLPTAPLSLR